jgi:predicted AAA+ superfamily ATPase
MDIQRFIKEPKTSFFLFGPRGTGKSTWLNQQFPAALYIDLLRLDTLHSYLANPAKLREVVEGTPGTETVIIDEIQNAPQLLSEVHSLIESTKKQFILTGSSARKLNKHGVDLLGGRAILSTMHPFLASELGSLFNLESALLSGLVPLVFSSADPLNQLRSYAMLYVQQEVKTEGLVRNLDDFARFLNAISLSHASLLNTSNVARECEVSRKTVESYIEIVIDLLLAFRIPPFTKRAQRPVVRHEKFFFFDAGIFRSLRPCGPLDHPAEIEGAALEGLVAQHLRALLAYSNKGDELFFWRSHTGQEVDFIVYGPSAFYAIEVKNTDRIRPEDLRGLKAFLDDYPEASGIIVYRGKDWLKKDRILAVPCNDFLLRLHPDRDIGDSLK